MQNKRAGQKGICKKYKTQEEINKSKAHKLASNHHWRNYKKLAISYFSRGTFLFANYKNHN